MIYLIQILHLLNAEQIELFEDLFEDFVEEFSELGYSPIEACESMLDSHFGLTIEDDFQLKEFAEKVQNKKLLTAAVNTVKLQKGI
jgi:hypothetical protein